MKPPAAQSEGQATTPSSRGRPRREQDPISAGLRRMWADAEGEAVPDSLMMLIAEIDSRSPNSGGTPGAGQ